MHAELVLGQGLQISHGRVEWLMRSTGLQGVHRRRLSGCTRRDQKATPSDDLVERRFTPDRPDRLYVADVTQHRTGEDCSTSQWSSTVSAAGSWDGRCPTTSAPELVVDALQTAIWNRRPPAGTVHHSDHAAIYTSWAFGHRLREAGLLGSTGTIGDCFDNSEAESFFATLQTELLDRSTWPTRASLSNAVFAFIEGLYNPHRRHSTLGYLSPADNETQHRAGHPAGRDTETAASSDPPNPSSPGNWGHFTLDSDEPVCPSTARDGRAAACVRVRGSS